MRDEQHRAGERLERGFERLALSTSRWFVGSSSTRKFAPDATSSASASRRRSPPESAVTGRSWVSQPEKRNRPSSVCACGRCSPSRPPWRRAPIRSSAARARAARSSRGRRRDRAGSCRARADAPSRIASSSVVFPAPFGPTSPTFSPRSTTIVASSSSGLSPAESVTSSASRTIRPLRGGSRKSKPSVRALRRQRLELAGAPRSAPSRAGAICVSFACACFAFDFL